MFFKSLLPAFLWGLFILIICGIPGHDLPELTFLDWLRPDKLVHLFIFGLLSYLLVRGFLIQESFPILKTRSRLWAFLIASLYGVLIEILQAYVFIDRSGDVRDAIADMIGAVIGIWCFNFLMKRKTSGNSASS
jgi:VanZ family protein